jgi:hypothetical protein
LRIPLALQNRTRSEPDPAQLPQARAGCFSYISQNIIGSEFFCQPSFSIIYLRLFIVTILLLEKGSLMTESNVRGLTARAVVIFASSHLRILASALPPLRCEQCRATFPSGATPYTLPPHPDCLVPRFPDRAMVLQSREGSLGAEGFQLCASLGRREHNGRSVSAG